MVCFGAVIYWLIFVGVTAGVFLLLRFVVADSLPPSKRRETDAARRARLKAVWEDEYRQMQAEARAQVDMAMASIVCALPLVLPLVYFMMKRLSK